MSWWRSAWVVDGSWRRSSDAGIGTPPCTITSTGGLACQVVNRIYCPTCENGCSEDAVSCPMCGHLLAAPVEGVPRVKPVRPICPAFCFWVGKSLQTPDGKLSVTKAMLAVGLIVFSVGVIRNAENREIKERKRISEIHKARGRADDARWVKQLAQRQTLQDIAGWRDIGGFETSHVARKVQARAANAAMRYPSLLPEEINLAFGIFGDLDGISYDELVHLAIAAHLEELEIDGMPPLGVLKARVRILQGRNRERIYTSYRLEVPRF